MVSCWLESSLRRVYPSSPSGHIQAMRITAARNASVSFQACVRNESSDVRSVSASVSGADDLDVTVRRVGYVPMPHLNTGTEESETEGLEHIPGFVPDPLFPESAVLLGIRESHAFWVTVRVPADVKQGQRMLKVAFRVGEEDAAVFDVTIDVCQLVVQPRKNFISTHWFYSDVLCDWYQVEPFEERFWTIVEPYIRNLVSHGQNAIHTPLFTPPTDGVKRPCQLLKVATPNVGKYEFDFSDVKRWVELARQCGAEYFEWTHLFTQWGVKNALRIYRSNQDGNSLLWQPETEATSDTYRNFLAQFLPQFCSFLSQEGIIDTSLFHLSDEPHGDEHLENYRKARALLHELAPWMKVMDALSDVRFAQQGLTDIPVASIGAAKSFREAGVPCPVYFCCGPRGRYLNRFLDTPLSKIRMSGWLFYRLKALGFLHWGYNYWCKSQQQELVDPFTESSATFWPRWTYGDPFVVYPGTDAPLDSIRWEVFGESLQDYAMLQTAGVSPDDPMLSDIREYDDFPKSESWIRQMRDKVLLAQ